MAKAGVTEAYERADVPTGTKEQPHVKGADQDVAVVSPPLSGEEQPDTPVQAGPGRSDSTEEIWESRFYEANYGVGALTEIFKTLRSRILLRQKEDTSAGTIMVTSAMPGEGKSFIAANLALSFASGVDQHVLLVDGDLRRSSMGKIFGRKEERGLVDYLRDNTRLQDLIVRTRIPKLSLLLAGKLPQNPAELLSSVLMKDLIDELSSRYLDRTIIFDTPPVMVAAEARILAQHVDGIVLVVRQGIAGKAKIEATIEAIGRERIIGIVFNDHTGNYFTDSSRYGYGYRYE